MRIHTAAELREIDRRAAETLGIPTILLMENAGRAIAEAARDVVRRTGGRVFFACGKGNNGGDGWCAARLLKAWGISSGVHSMAAIEELKGDALVNAKAARAVGGALEAALEAAGKGDVLVDALFGTGLSRPVEGPALEAVRAVNAARARGAYVIAVDVPSGIDADRPNPPGECVTADLTIALHALKPALVQYPARSFAGEIRVASIGIPSADGPGPERRWATRDAVARLLPRRQVDAHKGTNGHVLVVAGSPGKSGAAMLASVAALRAGAGLVTLATAENVLDRVLPAMPEVMGHALPSLSADGLLEALNGKDVLVIGPGIARHETTGEVLVELLRHLPIPIVIDADGLNALAADQHALSHLDRALARPLLTPHPAELARLLDTKTPEIQADRFKAATDAAKRFNAHVVLKGACSVVANPDGSLWVNSTGTPAMATAGTGDVLAGVCGALLAQGLDPAAAAVVGTFVHGRAGEMAADRGDRGLLAGDLARHLPAAFAELA